MTKSGKRCIRQHGYTFFFFTTSQKRALFTCRLTRQTLSLQMPKTYPKKRLQKSEKNK